MKSECVKIFPVCFTGGRDIRQFLRPLRNVGSQVCEMRRRNPTLVEPHLSLHLLIGDFSAILPLIEHRKGGLEDLLKNLRDPLIEVWPGFSRREHQVG